MRISKLVKFLGLLVFALVSIPHAALLAGVTASISGTVTDPSGAVVAGATVVATNVDTGVAVTLTTNSQGFYSFQSLPLGKYRIDVTQSGFQGLRPDWPGPGRELGAGGGRVVAGRASHRKS